MATAAMVRCACSPARVGSGGASFSPWAQPALPLRHNPAPPLPGPSTSAAGRQLTQLVPNRGTLNAPLLLCHAAGSYTTPRSPSNASCSSVPILPHAYAGLCSSSTLIISCRRSLLRIFLCGGSAAAAVTHLGGAGTAVPAENSALSYKLFRDKLRCP